MRTTAKYQRDNDIPTEYISLWFTESKEKNIPILVHCMICRAPLFQVFGKLDTVVVGGSEGKLPLIIKCKNITCGRRYYVHLLSEPDIVM